MAKLIFACLFLVVGLWGCDDCQKGPTCRGPLILEECPSEGFLSPKTCEPLCEVGDMDTLVVGPETCEFVDCFTLECITTEGNNALVEGFEDFQMDFMLIISVDGGEPINSECVIFQGLACR